MTKILHNHPQDILNHLDCPRCTLNKAAPKLLASCKALLAEAKITLEEGGSCEHNINICACGLISDIEEAEAAIALAEEKDDKAEAAHHALTGE